MTPQQGHPPSPSFHEPPPVPLRALPVELDYVPLSAARRPGIVTAIGVMSIVVAGLSLLSNLGMGLQGLGMLIVALAPVPAMPMTTVTTSTGRFTATSSVTVGPAAPGDSPAPGAEPAVNPIRGMLPADRAVTIDALAELRPLDAARRAQLDALLAECGQDVLPFPQVTPRLVKSNVSDHGVLPAGTSNAGADFFVLGSGRIDVSDREAGFVPADQPSDAVTVARGEGGTVVHSESSLAGATTAPAAAPPITFAGLSSLPPLLVFIEAVLSLGLAAYLLVIGILVLRNSPRGARLHWIYLMLKIPLAIGAGLAYAWMMSQLFNQFTTMGSGPGFSGFGYVLGVYAVVIGLAGLAYPIALIFVLRVRTVREYYGSGRDMSDERRDGRF